MDELSRPLPNPSASVAALTLGALDGEVHWARLVRREVWRHRLVRLARPTLESAVSAAGACASGMLAATAVVLVMRTIAYVL
jgi:hypothetical protein